jgi:hypothetical protein
VTEGLNPVEVAEQQKRHREKGHEDQPTTRSGRFLQIGEAILLSLVTVSAAWCGFAAAQYGTESRIDFSEAGQLRTDADSLLLSSLEIENMNQQNFNSWWVAYLLEDEAGMTFAETLFRPDFRASFDDWRSQGGPENKTVPSPFLLESYERPLINAGQEKLAEANNLQAMGVSKGIHGDQYVRITVFLSGILFLVGISSTFSLHKVRYALISVGGILLIAAVWQIFTLPPPTIS